MQMCVLELKERPGTPLFHLEHYIEGKYTKYNSNSGFVRDDARLTPQVRLWHEGLCWEGLTPVALKPLVLPRDTLYSLLALSAPLRSLPN